MLDAAAANERRQAPVADVLPRRTLMQTNTLNEAIGGADESDACVGRYAPREPERAADAGVTAAGNDDAMFSHVCLLDGQTGQPFQL